MQSPLVDSRAVYNNSDFARPRLVAAGARGAAPNILEVNVWEQIQRTANEAGH
jgi:hypothetical protein